MRRFIYTIMPLWIICSCSGTDSRIDEYLDNEDWNGLLSLYSSADSLRAIDISYTNIALAETGRLAEDAFKYFQAGPGCLLPKWERHPLEGEALAYMIYQSGHISLAQRMAFETDVCSAPNHDKRMIRLLVKTNLLYENWSVAEKYISYLERDGGQFARWATEQREFLHNPSKLAQDPKYGPKKACIPEINYIAFQNGFDEDIKEIIRNNPSYKNAVDILGIYYLLGCDFVHFKEFLDEFYGIEALNCLPRSFAEAACILSDKYRGYWQEVGVDRSMFRDFQAFKKRLGSGLSMEKYKDSYWLYVANVRRRNNK